MGIFDFLRNNNVKNENGLNEIYFDEGKSKQIKERFYKVNGKYDGLYEEFYDNGKVYFKSYYRNGNLHGKHEKFNDKGTLIFETSYINGVQEGETKSYYGNGNLYRAFNLVNGDYSGEINEYYDSSLTVNGRGNLKFNLLDYKYTFYDPNGIKNCEVEIELENQKLQKMGWWGDGYLSYKAKMKGVWKIYRNDGSINYELIFHPKKDNLKPTGFDKKIHLIKTTYTIGGKIYSETYHTYKLVNDCVYNFSSLFSNQRKNLTPFPWSKGLYEYDTGLKGPPGISTRGRVKLKPILDIKDVIKLSEPIDFDSA